MEKDMSNYYTADLAHGKEVTIEEFILKCAGAFNAFISLREMPAGVLVPDKLRPSDHHLKSIESAKKRFAEAEKLSNAQAEREAKRIFDEAVCLEKRCNEKYQKEGKAYTAMLKQVARWVPPTKDHEGLKCFMIEQLAEGIEWNCLHSFTMPKRLSGIQYRAKLIKDLRREIAYHTKEYAKEIQGIQNKNEWIQALLHSLKTQSNNE